MKKSKEERFFEILPGALVWSTLIGAVVFSYILPLYVIYFIILFDLYWIFRVFNHLVYLGISWKRYKRDEKIDWFKKLREIKRWEEIYHLIFLPTYKEGTEVLESTFNALIKSKYELKKFIIVLAGEEKDKENFLEISKNIKEKYEDRFFYFLITLHPKDISGEMAAKGSNLHYAGKKAKELIDSLNIPAEKIIVSSFDIDTQVHEQYFSYLTHKFLTHSDPYHSSFQPFALFNNNVWQSPALSRVVSRSTTFWLLSELARPEKLFTFSSHSMSFKALVDIDFWDNKIVSEDSRIFLQCLLHYNGNYRVTPLYLPVSMDSVYAGSLLKTLINQYKQQRRWGYGVEHTPYLLINFLKNKKISFLKKFHYLLIQIEGHYSWATAPILIFILGFLPLQVSKEKISTFVIAQNAPFVLESLMMVSMIGLIFSAVLSTILLPPRPEKYKAYKYLFMIFQWLLFPICTIFFGSIPSLEAQTRLMLGKYLSYGVTEKERK